ncbi:hypothetical protein NC652_015489 [Populus alba x Populus x berolinensis]|nr:hypothetical protein NC652_015489 [Populus alba x Populus x berolinensis]
MRKKKMYIDAYLFSKVHNSIISSGPDQSFDKTMAEKKVTTMVIKVDLECEKCHKKIKKVLCRIPQIQNQIYDKKAGTVTITVVCCSPEKIKEKIVCKGGEAVKSIVIKVPEKPKVEEKKPEAKPAPKPSKQPEGKPPETVDGNGKSKGPEKPKALIVEPVHPRTCCAECYRGISGGPCYHDYGRSAPPCYEAYGRPVYDSWFGGGGGYGCQRSGYYACRGCTPTFEMINKIEGEMCPSKPAHAYAGLEGPDQSFDKTMAEKKITTMVIKVDLECEKCHMKIKKVLCRTPQIQNLTYDKKAGTVTITVVCCSPEKIKSRSATAPSLSHHYICICTLNISIVSSDQSIHKTMVETQVTTMVIKVDLGCEKCHKKIKKVLCAIPQIQNQTYDQKKNTVTITVVGSCPEKIKKKIYCKGGECVKCIEIIKPPPKDDPPKPQPQPQPKPPPKTQPKQHNECPTPRRTCCAECSQGISGGPCYQDFCRPTRPCNVPCGRPVCDIWAVGGCSCRSRGYYVCRCEYFYEDYSPACKIM